jgi:hypothetical protein
MYFCLPNTGMASMIQRVMVQRHERLITASRCVAVACLMLGGLLSRPALGASVEMRLTVLNPRESSVTNCLVHKPLPQKITPKQVLDPDGLAVVYDVESRLYYVDGEVSIQPGTTNQLNIRLADIWNISDEDVDALLKTARSLVASLKDRDVEEDAKAHLLGDVAGVGIEKKLEKIRASQKAAAIRPGFKVADHISAYEEDLKLLDETVRDIRYLENLCLKEGIDLDSLVWDREVGPQETRVLLPDAYKSAVYQIRVKNPSDWERHDSLKRELPAEVTAADVLNSGGLDVTVENDRTYVVTNDVPLGVRGSPTEEAVFNIQIRDKWDVSLPRIVALREISSNVLAQIAQQKKFPKMEAVLKDLAGQVDAVAAEKGPETLDATYVAFFHDQAERLDVLEHRIRRIAAALNPQLKGSKLGFTAKPPSSKTTWALIYSILGFLALMSFLFFMRWFGKGDGEKPPTQVGKGGGN